MKSGRKWFLIYKAFQDILIFSLIFYQYGTNVRLIKQNLKKRIRHLKCFNFPNNMNSGINLVFKT